jgi:hypothetical protein
MPIAFIMMTPGTSEGIPGRTSDKKVHRNKKYNKQNGSNAGDPS